jgi:hypothetical protein
MRILFGFLVCAIFFSCSSPEETPPTYSDSKLAEYFAPAVSIQHQLWLHTDTRPGYHDSLYYFEFVGQSSNQTIDGLSPVSFYRTHDTSGANEKVFQIYVSDSAVITYGTDAQTQDKRFVILGNTLAVGNSWTAADSLLTAGGSRVKMKASVENYYPSIKTGDSVYNDAFRVIYACSEAGGTPSTEQGYEPGSTRVSYFAKQIGRVLEYVYDPNGKELWKNELQRMIVK